MDLLIVRNYTKYFISLLFLLISIFFLFSFTKIVNDKSISKGISLIMLIKTTGYLIPSIVSNSLTFASILSVFLFVGDMASKGELIAIRCSGYSWIRVFFGVIILLSLIVLLKLYLNHIEAPNSSYQSRKFLRLMTTKNTNIHLNAKEFETIGNTSIISSKTEKSLLEDVYMIRKIVKEDEDISNLNAIMRIKSDVATYQFVEDKGIIFSLNKGDIFYLDMNNPEIFYSGNFQNYLSFIPFEVHEKTFSLPFKFMTTKKLIDYLSSGNLSDTEKLEIKKEILSRTAEGFSVFFVTLFALIVAFIYESQSKYFSFLASIFIIFIHYSLTILVRLGIKNCPLLFPYIYFFPAVVVFFISVLIYRKYLRFL